MKYEYSINELIVHRREGLSIVSEVILLNEKEYYLIHTKKNMNENIYVPVDRADDIVRKIMTVEEADDLLKFMKGVEIDFNPNTKQRRDSYKRRLNSGELHDYAYLGVQLYFFKSQGEEGLMKLGPVDLSMLEYANGIILDELAVTYNQDRENIEEYVNQKMLAIK